MSLITWNPSDKSSSVTLSQGNLYVDTGNVLGRFVRATEGKTSGKWYFEMRMEGTANYGGHRNSGHLGLGTADIPLNSDSRTNSMLRGYRPSTGNKSSTSSAEGVAWGDRADDTGTVVGVSFDLDNGVMNIYKNGVNLGVIFDDLNTFNTPLYPIAVNSSTLTGISLRGTANFGATEFDIVQSNPKEWRRLKSEGYLPYDYENAHWFSRNKYLIKQGSNYHTINPGFYENGEYSPLILNGGLTPNINDFENYGFYDVGDLINPRSEIALGMEEDSIVGEGKVYRKTISGYRKILGIRNLD